MKCFTLHPNENDKLLALVLKVYIPKPKLLHYE